MSTDRGAGVSQGDGAVSEPNGLWFDGRFSCGPCMTEFEGGGYMPVGCPLCGEDMEVVK